MKKTIVQKKLYTQFFTTLIESFKPQTYYWQQIKYRNFNAKKDAL